MSTPASAEPAGLSLAEEEAIIERGLNTFVAVGSALMRIRDGRKYRDDGFASFEDYCRERWGFSRPRAYQLIGAAETLAKMSTIVDTELPHNEAQARELAAVPEDRRAEVWRQAVDRFGAQPTAAAIRSIARPDAAPSALPVEDIDGPPLFPRRDDRFAVVDRATGEIVGRAEPVPSVPSALAERIEAINERTAAPRSRELDAAARLVVVAADLCRVDPGEAARQARDLDPATADASARAVPGLLDWLTRYDAALRAPGNRVRIVR